jgi:hypothetical protein
LKPQVKANTNLTKPLTSHVPTGIEATYENPEDSEDKPNQDLLEVFKSCLPFLVPETIPELKIELKQQETNFKATIESQQETINQHEATIEKQNKELGKFKEDFEEFTKEMSRKFQEFDDILTEKRPPPPFEEVNKEADETIEAAKKFIAEKKNKQ